MRAHTIGAGGAAGGASRGGRRLGGAAGGASRGGRRAGSLAALLLLRSLAGPAGAAPPPASVASPVAPGAPPPAPLAPLAPAPAAAPPAPLTPEQARLAAARAHYERGESLYSERAYAAAWLEFNSSYQLAPLPELLYNMARCEARTRRPREALAHFRAYLAARPDDPEVVAIRKEMLALESVVRAAPPEAPEPPRAAASLAPAGPRVDPLALPPPPPRPPLWRTLPLYSMIGGGVGVVLLVSGAAAIGVGRSRYDLLSSRCAPACTDDELAPARSLSTSGFALLGIGAAVTLAAGILLPLELRWRRGAQKVALLPPLRLAGTF